MFAKTLSHVSLKAINHSAFASISLFSKDTQLSLRKSYCKMLFYQVEITKEHVAFE